LKSEKTSPAGCSALHGLFVNAGVQSWTTIWTTDSREHRGTLRTLTNNTEWRVSKLSTGLVAMNRLRMSGLVASISLAATDCWSFWLTKDSHNERLAFQGIGPFTQGD
jgi:hypothetical protein